MKTEVRYFTRTGNTKKLADAIGAAVNAPAKSIEAAVSEPIDLLFLGGSVYAAGIDKALKAFIETLKPEQVKKAAVFSTAAILPSAYPEIKKCLEARGILVSEKEFHCRGKFTLMHRGRPNRADLDAAAAYAKELIATEYAREYE
jgi:flavodoxin